MRIEFCEADVLEAFDDWRRAIGAGASRVAEDGVATEESAKHRLARAHWRHTSSAACRDCWWSRPAARTPDFDALIARVISELDSLAAHSEKRAG